MLFKNLGLARREWQGILAALLIAIHSFGPAQAQILNGDFEAGIAANCTCATNFTCANDAGRVEDGFHPLWAPASLGCVVGTTNYASPLGAHSGVAYIYFYAGADQIQTTPAQVFAGGEQLDLCIWYSGPPPPGDPGQNTPAAHFKLAVDGVQVGPNVPVPTGTPWTQHCVSVTMTPGPHVFNVLSGNAAQYTMWFDDFTVEDTNNPCDPVVITGDTVFCEGESVVLEALSTTALSYLWSTGEVTQTITVSSGGPFWVEITDPCGTSTDTVDVTMVGFTDLELGPDTVLCVGETLLLDAYVPEATYTWVDGSTDPTLLVSDPGYYFVERIDACGWSFDDIVIDVVPAPQVDLGPDTSYCEGSGVLLDVTYTGATYLWSDGSTDPTVFVDQPGTWWVEMGSDCGVISDTLEVFEILNIEPDIGNDTTLCPGGTLLLDASGPNTTHVWQDGSMDPAFLVTDAGYYFVVVENACGSFFSDILIDPLDPPSVDLGADQSLCAGGSIQLDATYPEAIYLWNDGSIGPSIDIDQSGTYWVEVSNACGTVSDTVLVDVLPLPVVDLGADTTICAGPPLLIDASFPGATYLWQDGSTSSVYAASSAGTYSVTLTTACGTVSDAIDVGVTGLPTVDLGPDLSLCPGATVLLDATSPGATYYWSTGSTQPNLLVGQGGNYTVQVTVPCGSVLSSVLVTYDQVPIVELGNDTTLCEGSILVLDPALPAADHLWQDGTTNATYAVSQPGSYSVSVSNACGMDSDTIAVSFIPVPVLDLGVDTTLCEYGTLELDASVPSAAYLWNTGETGSMITVQDSGWYWLELAVSCATLVDSIRVDVLPSPRIQLPVDTVVCDPPLLLLEVPAEEAWYEWQDGSDGGTFLVEAAGVYEVTVSNRCDTDRHSIAVSSIDCSCSIYVPNAFTPNSDGENDQFLPQFECELERYELHIFDRWGELITTIKDKGKGWDGTAGGRMSQDGVYVYKIDYTSPDEGTKHLYGHVTLLR